MRKLALAAAVTLLLALGSKPADAACRMDCPVWYDLIGYTLVAGLVGGYAGGTGYFIYRDTTDEAQTIEYGAGELAANTALGALMGGITYDAARAGHTGTALVAGSLTLVHAALATHGAATIIERRGEIRIPDDSIAWVLGIAYGGNAIWWMSQLGGEQSRRFGIVEAAVNAPIAAGLGYLAVDRARDGDVPRAALFGGMAALSGAFAVHGVRTAIAPRRVEVLDLGVDLAPTVVSDGREIAPALGASGTW